MNHRFFIAALILSALNLTGGCWKPSPLAKSPKSPIAQSARGSNLQGSILIEGSSTVEPIIIRASEEFSQAHPQVSISISSKGTSNGLLSLAQNEIDIANISRQIKEEELARLKNNHIQFIEIPIAFDGLTIVVNQSNDFIQSLTIDQLCKIFRSDLAASTWQEVHPAWPNQVLTVYAAGISSGTHDFLADVIRESTDFGIRSDDRIIFSEDDRLLVRGIRDDRYAIGFFGFHYYRPEGESLRAVPIVNDAGRPVTPSFGTISSGAYNPFRRTISICVNQASLRRLEVREFIEFLIHQAPDLVQQAGYVPLDDRHYRESLQRLRSIQYNGKELF